MSWMDDEFPIQAISDVTKYWRIHNRVVTDYLTDFRFLRQGRFIPEFVDTLREMEEPVMVDYGAPGTVLEDFVARYRQGRAIKGAAISYDPDLPLLTEPNTQTGVSIINGNVMELDTRYEIMSWLGNDTIDLFVSLPYGAFAFVDNTPEFYREQFNAFYERMNPEHGLMIVQVPPPEVIKKRNIPLKQWLAAFKQAGLTYDYTPKYQTTVYGHKTDHYGLVMVQRNSKAKALKCQ